ncbi:MAG TPA: YkgJ family cysteine cluster protein [Rectinemataceae bacterium]|nr:YkgJ family cysteine cluster protein [Rectinemataceae bacterium]
MGEPFYVDGLRFGCTRCSACCGGEPGYVFLSKDDLRRLLDRFKLDFGEFFREYCRLVDTGLGMAISLAEKPNYDCTFLGEGGCSVYDARPVQCSTYPFWAGVLESPQTWQSEASYCPGIGKGELVGRDLIERRLSERKTAGTILLAYGADPETLSADKVLGS